MYWLHLLAVLFIKLFIAGSSKDTINPTTEPLPCLWEENLCRLSMCEYCTSIFIQWNFSKDHPFKRPCFCVMDSVFFHFSLMQPPTQRPTLSLTNDCAWSLPNTLSKQTTSQWEFPSLASGFTSAVKNNAGYIHNNDGNIMTILLNEDCNYLRHFIMWLFSPRWLQWAWSGRGRGQQQIPHCSCLLSRHYSH